MALAFGQEETSRLEFANDLTSTSRLAHHGKISGQTTNGRLCSACPQLDLGSTWKRATSSGAMFSASRLRISGLKTGSCISSCRDCRSCSTSGMAIGKLRDGQRPLGRGINFQMFVEGRAFARRAQRRGVASLQTAS